MKPKISIITITYNSERTLEETIVSVITQEYDKLEYIIIDGGSSDSTLEIVNKYRDKISVVVSEPDKGISDAFNKGIRHATGEIIGIINSDDVLMPGALRAISDNYQPEIDVYRGNVVLWNDIDDKRLSTKPTMEFPLGAYIKSVCHQGTFVSKHAYEKWGAYKTSFRYMMDADLLHRLYLGGACFKYVDYDMALFRQGGVTEDKWTKKISEIKMLVKENKGGTLLANFMAVKFMAIQILKKVLFTLFGEERVKEYRYNNN